VERLKCMAYRDPYAPLSARIKCHAQLLLRLQIIY
jgi:hypothetical protein